MIVSLCQMHTPKYRIETETFLLVQYYNGLKICLIISLRHIIEMKFDYVVFKIN